MTGKQMLWWWVPLMVAFLVAVGPGLALALGVLNFELKGF